MITNWLAQLFAASGFVGSVAVLYFLGDSAPEPESGHAVLIEGAREGWRICAGMLAGTFANRGRTQSGNIQEIS